MLITWVSTGNGGGVVKSLGGYSVGVFNFDSYVSFRNMGLI